MSRTLGSLTKADLGETLTVEEWWMPGTHNPLDEAPVGKHVFLTGVKHEFHIGGSELTTIYTDTTACPSWVAPSDEPVRVASNGD